MKKFLSVLLCLIFVIGLLPPTVTYAESDPAFSIEEQYLASKETLLDGDDDLVPTDLIKIPEPQIVINPIYAEYFEDHPLPKFEENGAKTRGISYSYAKTVYGAGFELRNALREHLTNIYIGYCGPTSDLENYDTVESLIYDIWESACEITANPLEGDYIRTSWTGRSNSIFSQSVSGDTLYLIIQYQVQYWDSATQERQMAAAADAVIDSFGFTESTSAYDKIHAIYQYIANNISYSEYVDDPLRQSAYSAIVLKDTVCAGYSQLAYYMMWKCGIPCRIVCGTGYNSAGVGGPHAWNAVWLRGNWYSMDVTWDAGRTSYLYFLRGQDSGFYGTGYSMHATDRDIIRGYDYTSLIATTSLTDYGGKRTNDYGACQSHSLASTAFFTENNIEYDWCSVCGQSCSWLNHPEEIARYGRYSDLAWALYNDGDLYVWGSGEIPDYGCGWLAFRNVIRNVVLREGITGIGTSAFFDCDIVTDISIPETVTKIESGAFFNCESLQRVHIPFNINCINDYTFAGCKSLETIDFSDAVTDIGYLAFYNCSSLVEVYYLGSPAQWQAITIDESNTALVNANRHYACKVILNANGGNGTEETIWSYTDYRFPLFKNPFTHNNGIFLGWNTAANGSGTAYADEEEVIFTRDLTLYAQWLTPPRLAGRAELDQNILNWSAAPYATQYRVYRSEPSGSGWTSWAQVARVTSGLTWTDTAIQRGVQYKYRVRAYSSGFWSDYSPTKTLTAVEVIPTLTITAEKGKNTLNWSTVPNASKYRIYRSTYDNTAWGDWITVNSGSTGTKWADTSITPEMKYKYRIRAYVNGAWGSYSAEETITAASTVPAAPTLTVKAESGKNTLSWNTVAGAKYRIYRSEAGGAFAAVCTSTTAANWTDTNITPGVKYTYRVRANVSGVWGKYSNEVTVTTASGTPAAPKLTITPGTDANTLSWTAVAGAKYRVYRSASGGAFAAVCTSTTGTNWTDTDITPGVRYIYRVRANVGGVWGEYSNEVTAETAATTNIPTLTVIVSTGKVTTNWTKITGATQYRVYRCDNESGSWNNWSQVARLTSGQSWTDTSVNAGKSYKYRVRAYVNGTWADYSNEVTVKAK